MRRVTKPIITSTIDDDIVDEGSRLQVVLHAKDGSQRGVFYIFLLHLSFLTNRAVDANHPHPFRAPFLIHHITKNVRCLPAYFIKNGITHYGYQLMSRDRTYIKLYLTLISTTLKEHYGWLRAYELLRFVLFSNSGLMNPISHFDIIVRYQRSKAGRKVLNGAQQRKLSRSLYPFAPNPYHQSPSPHPYFIEFVDPKLFAQSSAKATPPILTSTGNMESILVANFLPTVKVNKSWLPSTSIKDDKIPKYSEKAKIEITQEFAPYSIYSRKLRELLSLPAFQPTHYNQSTQTLTKDPSVPLDLTYMYCHSSKKEDQSTQTEGMVLLSLNSEIEIVNTPRVQTEILHDFTEQVYLVNRILRNLIKKRNCCLPLKLLT